MVIKYGDILMKLSNLVVTATLLLSASSTFAHTYENISESSFEHELVQDTQDLNIYDSVEKLLHPKLTTKSFGPQQEPFLGLPMRYPTFAHPQAEQNIAQAFLHDGQPIVLFGPQAAMNLGSNIMGFFIQHEYAHHDLRHPLRNDIPSAIKEADADCNAAKSLVQSGMGQVIPQVVGWFQARGCNYNPSTPIQFVTDSHPCGTQRAAIIRQCAGM